jgi:hypothetical protein
MTTRAATGIFRPQIDHRRASQGDKFPFPTSAVTAGQRYIAAIGTGIGRIHACILLPCALHTPSSNPPQRSMLVQMCMGFPLARNLAVSTGCSVFSSSRHDSLIGSSCPPSSGHFGCICSKNAFYPTLSNHSALSCFCTPLI